MTERATIHVQFVRSGKVVFCRKWDFEPFEGSQPIKIGQLVVDSAAYMSYQLREGQQMTPSLKEVREALEMAEAKVFNATGKIDLELARQVTKALATLDRIMNDPPEQK